MLLGFVFLLLQWFNAIAMIFFISITTTLCIIGTSIKILKCNGFVINRSADYFDKKIDKLLKKCKNKQDGEQ